VVIRTWRAHRARPKPPSLFFLSFPPAGFPFSPHVCIRRNAEKLARCRGLSVSDSAFSFFSPFFFFPRFSSPSPPPCSIPPPPSEYEVRFFFFFFFFFPFSRSSVRFAFFGGKYENRSAPSMRETPPFLFLFPFPPQTPLLLLRRDDPCTKR